MRAHLRIWLPVVLLLVLEGAPALGQRQCKGVQGTVCTRICRQNTCEALVQLYKTTLNQTRPWINSTGWDSADCSAQLSATPSYCGWYGVQCCDQRNNCVANTVYSVSLPANHVNGSISSPEFLSSLYTLEPCGLKILEMPANQLSGTFAPDWGNFTGLEQLNMENNWIAGTLPDTFQLLENLTVLDVKFCQLAGTLPQWLTNLTSLTTLDLALEDGGNENSSLAGFIGTIPSGFDRLHKLEVLNLQVNALSGQIPEDLCNPANTSLQRLSLNGNNFAGSAKALQKCSMLDHLDLQYNLLTGELPTNDAWTEMTIYRTGDNRFSGQIPSQLFMTTLLDDLNIENNLLTGSIGMEVGLLSALTSFYGGNNNFTGTLPEEMFYLPSLTNLDLHGNRHLSGTLPWNIGYTYSLQSLDVSNTSLSGPIPQQMAGLWYLTVANIADSKMSCGDNCEQNKTFLPCFLEFNEVSANPYVSDSDEKGSAQLRCASVVAIPPMQRYLDGSCEQYVYSGQPPSTVRQSLVVWGVSPSYYDYYNCKCPENYKLAKHPDGGAHCVVENTPSWVWAVVAISCFAFLLMCVVIWVNFHSRIRRSVVNLQKRMRGVPTAGTISIVVTDIEGYSDLMKAAPGLMTRALSLHNAVVRKACWAACGAIVEQEGDSYTLIFSEALDAVVFCLQVQLALMKVDWPATLMKEQSGSGPRPDLPLERDQYPSSESLTAIKRLDSRETIPEKSELPSGNISEGTPETLGRKRTKSGPLQFWGHHKRSNSKEDLNSSPYKDFEHEPFPHGHKRSASKFFKILLHRSSKAEQALFNGLRVRMGTATGVLEPGQDIKNSSVNDMSKAISDLGNGGQVLMDKETFQTIKGRLQELGCVDESGINYKKMRLRKRGMCGANHPRARQQEEATVLDMGEYCMPWDTSDQAALRRGRGDDVPTTRGTKVFQILSPSLVGRARLFGNKLNLKDACKCLDPPFFHAPCALYAELCPSDSSKREKHRAIPPVTMVFCIVENAKQFVRRSGKEALSMHYLIHQCLVEALSGVEGGYLCRVQEGELKYMVAFSTAAAALQWCLIVQEALMYADWPSTFETDFPEELSSTGAVLFTGPRLKMGVCEGAPRAIIPDHLGRADYHGATINQAARYMDAAAHGGQIVCEEGLAEKVFQVWQTGCEHDHMNARGHGPTPSDDASDPLPPPASSTESSQVSLSRLDVPGGGQLELTRSLPSYSEKAEEGAIPGPQDDNESTTDQDHHPEYLIQSVHLGIFKFKGNAEPVDMVYVLPANLMERHFPADPPKGKGCRLEAKTGILDEVAAPLSHILIEMRERNERHLLERATSRRQAKASWKHLSIAMRTAHALSPKHSACDDVERSMV